MGYSSSAPERRVPSRWQQRQREKLRWTHRPDVPELAKAVAFVKAKPAWKDYDRAAQQESHVGINHKWQGNFFDPDGTRTEFMEADTADGLPMPMSSAPYYQ